MVHQKASGGTQPLSQSSRLQAYPGGFGGLSKLMWTESLSYEWKLENSAKFPPPSPKKNLAHVNRNKRMGTRMQHLLNPDGCTAIIDQEMTDLLKQTFQGFYRTDKGSTPTFHLRTKIHMASTHFTESETQRALEVIETYLFVL